LAGQSKPLSGVRARKRHTLCLMSSSSGGAFCVDAGGSNSVVRLRCEGGAERTWRTPSCAIAAVGEDEAFRQLRSILAGIETQCRGEGRLRGCVASSSFPVAGEGRPPAALIRAIAGSGCTGRVFLVNDVVPLLWTNQLGGCGIVVNSGTGSAVLGRNLDGRLVKLGGHEHILSDSGSAYALARKGLRAAVLAADRMGPKTDLEPQAEAFYGLPVRELGRRFAETSRPRQEVARFAPEVTMLAQTADEVALAVTRGEAALLAETAVEAHRRLGLDSSAVIAFSGGVMRGSPFYRGLVSQAINNAGIATEPLLLDSVDAALAFAHRDGPLAAEVVGAMGGLVITVA
jgi:N-acetylglucosamine kinase-like BadF-type ATPase